MDTTILRKAGLTESQAKGYIALIEHGTLSPTDLAVHINESRTNAYAIADKLVSLGLATKKDDKKAVYTANHPSTVEELAERRRKVLVRNEKEVKQGLSELIDRYYQTTDRPGVRYLQGRSGLETIYDDILASSSGLQIVRTPNEKKFFSGEIFENFVTTRIKLGIKLKALTPFTVKSNTDPRKDLRNLLERQFFPEDMYTAPVEIDVYGSKVGFISFGEDLSGVIIENPHIANAMRELLVLVEIGAKTSFESRPELVERLRVSREEYAEKPDSV